MAYPREEYSLVQAIVDKALSNNVESSFLDGYGYLIVVIPVLFFVLLLAFYFIHNFEENKNND